MEGNVLFNDALNTFYLRLYGVRHMVKDHTDSGRGNLQQGFFYMHHPTYRITHTTAFVTPVVEHWLERKIAIGPPFTDTLNTCIRYITHMRRKEGNVLFNDAVNTFILIVISHIWEGRKEENVLFNDALNTFMLIVISHI